MIAGYSCKPVFQYQFRPLTNQDHRAADGGFCIILYENRILSFSTYDVTAVLLMNSASVFPAASCSAFSLCSATREAGWDLPRLISALPMFPPMLLLSLLTDTIRSGSGE